MMTEDEIKYEIETILWLMPMLNDEGKIEYQKRLDALNEIVLEQTILA